MSQPVEINPDGVRSAATEFDNVADHAQDLLNTLTNAANSMGEPWGGDKAGKKFADGDTGYKTGHDTNIAAASQLVQILQQNAQNLRDAAKTFEDNEKKSAGPQG